MSVSIKYASKEYESYAQAICDLIESAAKKRGTGIAKRDPEYIKSKMYSGNAVIALD
ncbi:MAG: GNAT family N-acetyltransferase, partial [Balneolaceae bacterium]